MNPTSLLAELNHVGVGVRLAVDDPDALDLDAPAGVLTTDLISLIQAHKTGLITLLGADDNTTHVDSADSDKTPVDGTTAQGFVNVSSVNGVTTEPGEVPGMDPAAQPLPPPKPIYTAEEKLLIAKAPPRATVAIDQIKNIFADAGGATLTEFKILITPRQRAAGLIRGARQGDDRDGAVALRDAWAERIAICTVDGGATEAQAQRLALAELEVTSKRGPAPVEMR